MESSSKKINLVASTFKMEDFYKIYISQTNLNSLSFINNEEIIRFYISYIKNGNLIIEVILKDR